MSNRLLVLGYSETDVRDMLAARKLIDGYFNGTNSRAAAAAALTKTTRRPWFGLMYLPTAETLSRDPKKSVWAQEMDLDPMAAVERVKVPIVFILGAADPVDPGQRNRCPASQPRAHAA